MASVVTYLVVSAPNDPSAVQAHAALEDTPLELQKTTEADDGQTASLTFIHQESLEEASDLNVTAQTLSGAFPQATILLTVIEERFDHVERLKTKMYSDGNEAGELEHGHIFNIGSS